ncbi:MAG: phosphatase [Actinomycetia bacterium]|nr:phosphatase [Actinomycetes bacterium]
MTDGASSGARLSELPFDGQAVLSAAGRAIIVTDGHGTILTWNREAEHLYGWVEHEVVGRDIREVLVPEHMIPAAVDVRATLRGGRAWSGDFTVQRRNGAIIPIRLVDAPILDEDGTLIGIVGISEDVTAQRLLEAELRDSTTALRVSLDAGRLGTWRWDLASQTVAWDETLERLFGMEPRSFDGTFGTYVALLHPDDRDDVLRRVDEALVARSDYNVEHRVVWPDGSVRWLQGRGAVTIDAEGAATGTVGCVTDITDSVLNFQRTEGAARQLAALAEASVAIASSLSLAQVTDRVTDAGRRIIGCERVDIVMSAEAGPDTLVAPLAQRDGAPLGALRCAGIPGGTFTAEDEAVLVQLAHMASAAIENARLYEAEQRARRRNDELSASLQAGLLPTLGQHVGVRVASRYRPGEERLLLGGDFVDAVTTPSGLLGFCIGDVSGHGPGPAAIGAGLRAAWRALALSGDNPSTWHHGLGRVFDASEAADELFVTMITGTVDATAGRITLVCAGHPAPILLGPGASVLDVLAGPPLGIAGEPASATTIDLPERWGLVLHTDGLFEGRAAPGATERLGQDALVSWLAQRGEVGDEDLDDLIAYVEWANGAPIDDDVAVLLLRST